jgi:transmembrane 9 superfamily protein 2/4
MLLLFVLMGAFAGFTSARLYKTFKGKAWQNCTLLTALLYPGLVFAVFFGLDIVVWSYGSTGKTSIVSCATEPSFAWCC